MLLHLTATPGWPPAAAERLLLLLNVAQLLLHCCHKHIGEQERLLEAGFVCEREGEQHRAVGAVGGRQRWSSLCGASACEWRRGSTVIT
jgi:hypothetical protein